jgi:predicted transcriptional regulator
MGGQKIDDATKREVMRAYSEGVTRKGIAELCGISLSSVGRILKGKNPQPSRKDTPKTKTRRERQEKIGELERRVAELERKILELESRKGS